MPTPKIDINTLKTAEGVAITPLTTEEQAKDDLGFTHPNLHRRVDVQQPTDPREVAPRKYTVGVYDKINSYRTTEISYHDEESTTCEIP